MPRKYSTTSAKFDQTLWFELKRTQPELTAHGKSYAIEVLFCREIGIEPPPPPSERIQAGADARGKQLTNASRAKKGKKI